MALWPLQVLKMIKICESSRELKLDSAQSRSYTHGVIFLDSDGEQQCNGYAAHADGTFESYHGIACELQLCN